MRRLCETTYSLVLPGGGGTTGPIDCGERVQVGVDGLECVVCGIVLCARHGGPSGIELQCCANHMRDCAGCGQTRPANDGCDEGADFLCSICIGGIAVISVTLSPLEVRDVKERARQQGPDEEVLVPLCPIFEMEHETV